MDNRIKELWERAEGILILAGAGMGVDAGIPDFRGPTGPWTEAKERFITLATLQGMEQDPLMAWNFYCERLYKYRDLPPHNGYYALKSLIDLTGKDHFVLTSNVDEHFARAGFDPERIHEIHGSLGHLQCLRPCSHDLTPTPRFEATFASTDEIPRCERCGALMRPNVMMFGDAGLVWSRIDAGEERYTRWLAPKMDVLGIELGAGTAIPSIRIYGQWATSALIRINPNEHEVDRDQDIGIAATAIEGINQLINAVSS